MKNKPSLQPVLPDALPAATIRQRVRIQTAHGPADFLTFHGLVDKTEHVALVYQPLSNDSIPLVRVHSECLTGDIFGSSRCDCGEQLTEAQKEMSRQGGVILYLRQEGRGIGLYNKIDAYAFQDLGYDTFEANHKVGQPADARSYGVAAQMLNALGLRRIRLLTNNPEKAAQLREFGIDVRELQRTHLHVKEQNRFYLKAKAVKGGHLIELRDLEPEADHAEPELQHEETK